MINILLGIGLLLIVIILFLIFRVLTLLSLVPGRDTRRVQEPPGNKANGLAWPVFILAGLIAIILSAIATADEFLPDPSSVHGVQIDDMFWVTNGIIGAVFIGLHG